MMKESIFSIGIVQSFAIAFISFLALEKWKIHPAFLIIASFAYGGLILPHL
jgi:chromate transporter